MKFAGKFERLSRLREPGRRFNGGVGNLLALLSSEDFPQFRELLVSLEPADAPAFASARGGRAGDQSTPTATPRVSPIARFSTRSAIGSRPVGSRLTITKVVPLRLASSGNPAAG